MLINWLTNRVRPTTHSLRRALWREAEVILTWIETFNSLVNNSKS